MRRRSCWYILFVLNPRLSLTGVHCSLTAGSNDTTNGVPPVAQTGSYTPGDPLYSDDAFTNVANILHTLAMVKQKTGVAIDARPGEPVPETMVTAVDGQLTKSVIPGRRSSWSRRDSKDARNQRNSEARVVKRTNPEYTQVFTGTGTGPKDRDGSIEGTAYLTYSVVSNSTYNVDACLAACDKVTGCGWSYS